MKVNTRTEQLASKESVLIEQEKSLKTRAEQYEQGTKDLESRKDKADKMEADLNNKETQLNNIDENLKQKETELESRQNVINKKLQQIANNSSGKVAYLTFDDGPSANTSKILDILDEYKINATFFVNGHAGYENTYLRIVNAGNKIGNHTYSHDYGQVYTSVEGFNAEVDKLNNYLESLGINKPDIIRFPGGSNSGVSVQYGGSNIMSNIIKSEIDRGYDYFDWNVSSGDAEKVTNDKDSIINNVINGCKGKKSVVILFHDSQPKTTTVEALPTIIDYLIQEGYSFKTLQQGLAPWSKFSN